MFEHGVLVCVRVLYMFFSSLLFRLEPVVLSFCIYITFSSLLTASYSTTIDTNCTTNVILYISYACTNIMLKRRGTSYNPPTVFLRLRQKKDKSSN